MSFNKPDHSLMEKMVRDAFSAENEILTDKLVNLESQLSTERERRREAEAALNDVVAKAQHSLYYESRSDILEVTDEYFAKYGREGGGE